jgi:hypothetical protein
LWLYVLLPLHKCLTAIPHARQTLLKCSFLIMFFTLVSCQDVGTAKFIVKNKSSSKIDSLYFMPCAPNSRHYLNLNPGEEQLYNLSMTGQTTDGAYGIIFRMGNEKVSKVFGYFSNGAAMEKHTVVEIMDDTLIFKPKY